MAKSCITVCFTYSLRLAIFWTDISRGSVTTRLGCGGVFVYDFVTNFLLNLTVEEFWKSVNIWWSYGQELGVLFFWLTVYKRILSSVLSVRPPVRLSVCPIIRKSAAGLLLSAVWAGDINRQRRPSGARWQRPLSTAPQHGARQQMRAVSRWQPT